MIFKSAETATNLAVRLEGKFRKTLFRRQAGVKSRNKDDEQNEEKETRGQRKDKG